MLAFALAFAKKHDKGDADLFLLINHNNIAFANRNQLRSVKILLFQVQSLPKVPLMQITVEQCFNSSNFKPITHDLCVAKFVP